MENLESKLIKRTLRVPALPILNEVADGSVVARQLDVVLMANGFKLSGDLLKHLSVLHPVAVKNKSVQILNTAKELIGAHVEHNVYFKDFPDNVPDTEEFWTECIIDALFDPKIAATISLQLSTGVVNLLDLPKYGKYLHSYEDMVVAHEQFMPTINDKITVLHLGDSLIKETLRLYFQLAESKVPVNEDDRMLLTELAELCIHDNQPQSIPVRENKAIINTVRLLNNKPLLINTITDILRLAASLSGGDVTLEKPTKFKSFPRSHRRTLLSAIETEVDRNPEAIEDVCRYTEQWKRLGERLHPHEYKTYSNVQQVFSIARSDTKITTFTGKMEAAFSQKKLVAAIDLLKTKPGVLFRNLDRIARDITILNEFDSLIASIKVTAPKVSGRVLLSVREHLMNRVHPQKFRIFANKKGSAWVSNTTNKALHPDTVNSLLTIIDVEISNRLPKINYLVIDPEVIGVALPLSEKNKGRGFGIMPRGSISQLLTKDTLRFFVHWKEKSERTDYDLSVLFLNSEFENCGQLSWTNLRNSKLGVHSGDITSAPNGASEFINIYTNSVSKEVVYIVPQVNVYCGNTFDKAEEAFFGFMVRELSQKGLPLEPQTVQMKSDLSGDKKIALPLVFIRSSNGWAVKWMNLYSKGMPRCNRVEANKLSTSLLIKGIVGKEYLDLGYLISLQKDKATTFEVWHKDKSYTEPVTYVGLEIPENLPKGSTTYTLTNLGAIVPK